MLGQVCGPAAKGGHGGRWSAGPSEIKEKKIIFLRVFVLLCIALGGEGGYRESKSSVLYSFFSTYYLQEAMLHFFFSVNMINIRDYRV